jgi:hypothetical protein
MGSFIAAPRIHGASDAPSARELLAHYVNYLDQYEAIQYRLRERTSSKGGLFTDWTWTSSTQAEFAKSGHRWRCWEHSVGLLFHNSNKISLQTDSENTFDGKVYILVDRADRTTQESGNIDEPAADRLLDSGMHGRVETTVVAEIDADQPTALDMYKKLNETCNVYGYLPADDLTVAELLGSQATRLTIRTEDVAGQPCHVLEGMTSHGRIALWLDPSASFAPVRLQVTKGEEDMIGKVAMKTLEAPTDQSGPEPALALRGMEVQINYRIEPVADRPTIVGYTRLDRYLYEKGEEYQRRDEVQLSEIRFDPSASALEPTLPIPEETPVIVRNALGLSAKWSGGKIVFDSDKETVDSIQGKWVSEVSGTPWWRRALVWCGAVLALLGIVWFGWARWRSRD